MAFADEGILKGLSEEQVLISRNKYGSNALKKVAGKTFFARYIESFADPMIRILLIALAINIIFLIRTLDWYEPLGIAISIFIATTISALSEHGSQSAFEKLKEEAGKLRCRVIRGENIKEIPAEEIVCGDYVMLSAGDMIPADGCLYSGYIEVNQSALNGETKEAIKRPTGRACKSEDFNAENTVFRGSVVCGGEGVFVVTKVGDNTFYGNLAQEIQSDTRESPMKIRLAKLAATISRIGCTGAVMVAVSYIFRILYMEFRFNIPLFVEYYSSWEILIPELLNIIMLSVTVIVVSVPEGLPMMITVVLSANMKKMLADNVLVRKMVGIETAGSMNILFTDKTGTLTKGQLSVCSVITGEGRTFLNAEKLQKAKELWNIFYISSYYNNDACYTYKSNKRTAVGGNATDRALLEFISARDCPLKLKLIKKMPFDSIRKYSLAHTDNEKYKTLIKGAPEKILSACKYCYNEKGGKIPLEHNAVQKILSDNAQKAVRMLAMAVCDSVTDNSLGEDCTLVCLIGIHDEIRTQCRQSIVRLARAGIQVVMVTGDNKETAAAVAKNCGIITSEKDWITDSNELSGMTDSEIEKKLLRLKVVARALPSDKSRLVRIAQKTRLVAGMTGDGINDAPALKAADVGFAMGSGSDVSKEAADIVILDDNIESITKAVLYGRTIFKSIRKFVIYQLTVNLCAVGLSVIAPLLGVKTPITIMQMLWINLVMDTLGGLAFSGEPVRESYMTEEPKQRDENILNKYMISQVLWTGCYSLLLCILFIKIPLFHFYIRKDNPAYIMTALFALFMFIAIFNSLNARTHNIDLTSHLSKNKPFVLIMSIVFLVQSLMIYLGGNVFRTQDLTLGEYITTLLLAFTVIPVDIIRKMILSKKGKLRGV